MPDAFLQSDLDRLMILLRKCRQDYFFSGYRIDYHCFIFTDHPAGEGSGSDISLIYGRSIGDTQYGSVKIHVDQVADF